MNETIFTSIDKQAFLETLEADPEWAFEVLNRLLKRKERAETFREWLGINELARAIQDLAEAQQRTEQQVQALAHRFDALAEAQQRTEQQVQALAHRFDVLAEAQQRTEQQVQALAHRFDALAEAQQRTEQQVQALAHRFDVLAEAQQKTEQQVMVLTHHVSTLSEVLGPTWEEEALESVAFLLPKSGVRLLTPLEAQLENEWDGVRFAPKMREYLPPSDFLGHLATYHYLLRLTHL